MAPAILLYIVIRHKLQSQCLVLACCDAQNIVSAALLQEYETIRRVRNDPVDGVMLCCALMTSSQHLSSLGDRAFIITGSQSITDLHEVAQNDT